MPHDVVCLSHQRWEAIPQRPHHLMKRCARDARVFFVEDPVFDAREPVLAKRTAAQGVQIVLPHLPPSGLAEAEGALRRLLDGLIEAEGLRRPLLWFSTPRAVSFAGHLRGSPIIYDCAQDPQSFRSGPPDLAEREREILRIADLVFTAGHELFEAKRAHHPRVHAFPSTVDATHFARARAGKLPEPEDQSCVPRPRVGYCGTIDRRVDCTLLVRLADAHADWQIVMLGPRATLDVASLPLRSNIHWLGQKRYDELPAYVAGWDVAILPLARGDAARFASPAKTLAYFAAGKPVVSTPIRDLVRPLGAEGLVRVGEDLAFVEHVEAALAARGTAEEDRRRERADALVASTSWDRTWGRMRSLLLEMEHERRHDEAGARR
jgi:UDP-galactopyranose mutase